MATYSTAIDNVAIKVTASAITGTFTGTFDHHTGIPTAVIKVRASIQPVAVLYTRLKIAASVIDSVILDAYISPRTAAVSSAVPMTITSGVSELRQYRGRARVNAAWGAGTDYIRVFDVSPGSVETALGNEFAFGALIHSNWIDQDFSYDIDGPRVVAVSRKQKPGSGSDMLTVTYREIDTLKPCHSGYNETSRSKPRVKGGLAVVTQIAGITTSENDTSNPEAGDVLDNGRALPTVPNCVEVQYDTDSIPGRTVVWSTWMAFLPMGAIAEPRHVA